MARDVGIFRLTSGMNRDLRIGESVLAVDGCLLYRGLDFSGEGMYKIFSGGGYVKKDC